MGKISEKIRRGSGRYGRKIIAAWTVIHSMKEIHQAVLKNKVIEYLSPKPNENFIDGTIDGGGHTKILLEKIKPRGKILGIDLDKKLLDIAALRFKKEIQNKRLILVNNNFKNLKAIAQKYNFCKINGVLLDLGLSSWHLEKSGRGFSFQRDEILDMNYTPKSQNDFEDSRLTAREIVNTWSESEIYRILKEYSQERYSRRIAKEIIKQRKRKPIITTLELVNTIRRAVPSNYERGRIHFATRTFQSLRITVNRELENLKEALEQSIEVLKQEGRIVVISFNSLEDRIVKNFFREEKKQKELKILTKKPIRPTQEEIRLSPKSRSAKLRAAEVLRQ